MIKSLSWAWIVVGLIATGAVMSVLIVTDSGLSALGVPGVASLQGAPGPAELDATLSAWRDAGAPALARVGFSLGWDYLFIAVNGIAFTLAGLKAREELVPAPGALRAIALVLVLLLPVGGALDAVENIFQLQSVLGNGDAGTARMTAQITGVKWALVVPGLLIALAGLTTAGIRAVRRR